jgi:thioredoxin reductase (NADPH)
MSNCYSAFFSSICSTRSRDKRDSESVEEEVGTTIEHSYQYDLVVIGGGSGGLAASKEAAKLGAKVACMDYVVPSPSGTTWGLGGTCVNVGCIPKKLMHQAGILGEGFSDAKAFGWNVNAATHDWPLMVGNIQDYVGSLNWAYRVTLRENNVEYINAKGAFKDAHTIVCTMKNGKVGLRVRLSAI